MQYLLHLIIDKKTTFEATKKVNYTKKIIT